MTISFSGLASGIDTSSWVESLVALKRAKVTTLQEQKEEVSLSKDTLSNIKSFFAAFRSTIQRITDSRFNIVSMDLFAQNIATSANLNVLTATATSEAQEGTYKVKVDKIATATKATSKHSYMTTIVETTTATSNSLLKHLGVRSGTIGVKVNGINYGVQIKDSDTIATFIEKLKGIGVEADYNENTGVFSVNLSAGDIQENGTNIIESLHLDGVNEGYEGSTLTIETPETIFSMATESTLMTDLGVGIGAIKIEANGTTYTVATTSTTDIGDFVTALQSKTIDATFANGVFTLEDATIIDEGGTDIIRAMGLSKDIYSKSQETGTLKLETTIVETTVANENTLLKDLGNGIAVSNGDNVIVKNSNDETITVSLTEGSSVKNLLDGLKGAGLYADINSDGIVEISGGTIIGGSFDIKEAFGLEENPYTAMVTGNPLTETITEYELVTLQTRLVEDLGVTRGYLEVTDSEGNKYYEKIYSGQTISDLMADFANLGIYSKLDERTGILEITGGAFRTMTDDEVNTLIGNHTIAETDDNYKQGTNLLECLYGSDVIATEQITVASTYSRSRALTRSVTTLTNATLDTTLGTLGLETNGTAIFDVRGDLRTIDVTTTMTVQGLMDALEAQGIESSWDADFSRITINNATIDDGTSNLNDVLNLSETISGKYVTSKELYSNKTIAIIATETTTLNELGVSGDQTVTLYCQNGDTHTFEVGQNTTLGALINSINTSCTDVTANLEDGVFRIEGGYIVNSAIENALDLEKSANSHSNVLGTKVVHTITANATGTSTLGEIITSLGTQSEVSGGYNLKFNDEIINVSANTTLDDVIWQIHQKGGTTSTDSSGRLHIEGGTLSGTVATALGFSSVSTTNSVAATGQTITTINTVCADTTTKLGKLGFGDSTITIKNTYNEEIGTITTNADMTIGDLLSALSGYGISGSITNGVITLRSEDGNYATGGVLESMGIGTDGTTVTTTVGVSNSSSSAVTFTSTKTADSDTKLSDLGVTTDQKIAIKGPDNANVGTVTVTSTMTIGDVLTALAGYGISGTINAGKVYLDSEIGNYAEDVSGSNLISGKFGISSSVVENYETTAGTTATSSALVSNTSTANSSTTLGELGITSTTITVNGLNGTTVDTITANSDMTIGDVLTALAGYGISGTIEDGKVYLDSEVGNYATGDLMTKFGITTSSVNVTTTIKAESASAITIAAKHATSDTKLSELGKGDSTITVFDTYGNAVGTVTTNADMTIGDVLTALAGYGISGTIKNGVISLDSSVGNYATGGVLTDFGITAQNAGTTTIGKQNYSTKVITATYTELANGSSKLKDLNLAGITYGDIYVKSADGSTIATISTNADMTLDELLTQFSANGVSAYIENGVIKFSDENSNYVVDSGSNGVLNKLGISYTTSSSTVNVAGTYTSSAIVSATGYESPTLDTKLSELNSTIVNGTVDIYDKDGVKVASVSVNKDDTVGAFFDKLNEYGIYGSLETASDGNTKVVLESPNGYYVQDAAANGVISKLGFTKTTGTITVASGTSVQSSNTLQYEEVTTTTVFENVTLDVETSGTVTIPAHGSGTYTHYITNTITTTEVTTVLQTFTVEITETITIEGTQSEPLVYYVTTYATTTEHTTGTTTHTIETTVTLPDGGTTVITSVTQGTTTTDVVAGTTITVEQLATADTKLSDLGITADQLDFNIQASDLHSNTIHTLTTIALTTESTIQDFINACYNSLEDEDGNPVGVLQFSIENGVLKTTTDSTYNGFKFYVTGDLADALGIATVTDEDYTQSATSTAVVTYTDTILVSTVQTITTEASTTITVQQFATEDTKLTDLGVTIGSTMTGYYADGTGIYGYEYVVTESSDFDELMQHLDVEYGIDSELINGVFTITSDDKYVTGTLAEALGIGVITETDSTQITTSGGPITYTKTTTTLQTTTVTISTETTGYVTVQQFATRDTKLTYLGATIGSTMTGYNADGTDIHGYEYVVTESSTLNELMQHLDVEYGIDSELINGVFTITSDDKYVTGALAEALGIQTIDESTTFQVIQSEVPVTYNSKATANTKLKDLGVVVSNYNIQIYYDENGNNYNSFTITTLTGESTLDNLFSALRNHSDVHMTASINDGVISIQADGSDLHYFADGSILSALGISVESATDGSYEYHYNSNSNVLYNNAAPITITEDSTFADMGMASNCYITIVTDDTMHEVLVNSTDTYGDLFTELANYGIVGSINNGIVRIQTTGDATINNPGTFLESYLFTSGITTETIPAYSNTHSKNLVVNKTITVDSAGTATIEALKTVVTPQTATLNWDTTFGELNPDFDQSEIEVYHNGENLLFQVYETTSVGEFLTELASAGLTVNLDNGQLTILGDENSYIVNIDYSIREALRLQTVNSSQPTTIATSLTSTAPVTGTFFTTTTDFGLAVTDNNPLKSSSTYVNSDGEIVGTGTIVEIRTAAALIGMFGKGYNGYEFVLKSDLDITHHFTDGIVLDNCIFDAQGFNLNLNLVIDDSEGIGENRVNANLGMFKEISYSEIKNLSVTGSVIIDPAFDNYDIDVYAGGLIGFAYDSHIAGVRDGIQLDIGSSNVIAGGLVGVAELTYFERINAAGGVNASGGCYNIGGIVGKSSDSYFSSISSNMIVAGSDVIAGISAYSVGDNYSHIYIDPFALGMNGGESFSALYCEGSGSYINLDTIYSYSNTQVETKLDGAGSYYANYYEYCSLHSDHFLYDGNSSPILKVFDDEVENLHFIRAGVYNDEGRYMGQVTINTGMTIDDVVYEASAYGISFEDEYANYGNGKNRKITITGGYIESSALFNVISDAYRYDVAHYDNGETESMNSQEFIFTNGVFTDTHIVTADSTFGEFFVAQGYNSAFGVDVVVYDTYTGEEVHTHYIEGGMTIEGVANSDLANYCDISIDENGILRFEPKYGYYIEIKDSPGFEDTGWADDFKDVFNLNSLVGYTVQEPAGDETYVNSDSNVLFQNNEVTVGANSTITIETVTTVAVENTTLNWDTTFAELGITENKVIGLANRVNITSHDITIKADDTVGSLFTQLASYDINAYIDNGSVIIQTTGDYAINSMPMELENALNLGDFSYTYKTLYANSTSDTLIYDKEMTIETTGTITIPTITTETTVIPNIKTETHTIVTESIVSSDTVIHTLVSSFTIDVTSTGTATISAQDTFTINVAQVTDKTHTIVTSVTITTTDTESMTIGFTTTGKINTFTWRTETTTATNTATGSTEIGEILNASKTITSTQTISVKSDGTVYTVQVEEGDTINDVLTALAGLGIYGNITNGKVSLVGDEDSYITYMSNDLKTVLGITGNFTTTTEVPNASSQTTGDYRFSYTNTISTDDTFAELGMTANGVITIASSGTSDILIEVKTTDTVNDMLTQLASYGIHGSITDGKLTLNKTGDYYIKGLDSTLNNVLKLQKTADDSTVIYTASNDDSNTLNTSVNSTATTADTFSAIGVTSQATVSVVSSGTTYVVTINPEHTIDDFLTTIAGLGIRGSLDNGILTLVGDKDAYISDMDNTLAGKLFIKEADFSTTVNLVTNNASSTLSEAIVNGLSGDDTFAELNLGAAQATMTVVSDGKEYTITVDKSDTVDDLLTALAGLGIHGHIENNKLTLEGDNSAYIKNIDNNLKTALGFTSNSCFTTTVNTSYTNNNGTVTQTFTDTLSTDDTFADLKMAGTGYMTVMSNGTEYTITINPEHTVDDLLTSLSGLGIYGSVEAGKITLQGNENVFVKGMTDNVKNALGLTSNSFYTTSAHTTKDNTNGTITQQYTTTNTLSTDDTFGDMNLGTGTITVVSNGTRTTIAVATDDTVDDILTQLASYGITGNVDNGILTLTGNKDAYILGITDNLRNNLKLGTTNYTTTSHTADGTSNAYSVTVVGTATGVTKLQDLRDPSGNAPSDYNVILTTKSDAGNETNVTLTFAGTDDLYKVIDELTRHGLDASIDSTGRFAVKSSTLTDFDISGGLGTFLMTNNYQKIYDEGSTNNISTQLTQLTEVNMDDSTQLSKLGITDGNIILYQNGVLHTIAIDSTKTIGNFRNQLADYGVNSEIINGQLQLIADGVVYTTTPASGASNIVTKLGIQKTNWNLGGYSQESKELGDTQTIQVVATMQHTVGQLTEADGTSLGITAGSIYVYQDGTRSTVDINLNDTLEDLSSKLSQYGITVGIDSNGKVYFEGDNNSYLAENGTSNILTKLNVNENWSTRYDSTSETLDYDIENDPKVVGSTKLVDLQDASGNDLGISTGAYYVYQNGVRTTETITEDTTIDDFRATMATYGISTDFDENGSLAVGAYNETYLATAATGGDNTNAIDILFEKWNFTNIYTSNDLEIPTDVTVAISETTKLADINETPDIFDETITATGTISVIKDGVKTDIDINNLDTVGDLIDELALYGFETVINGNGQLIIKNTGDSRLEATAGTKGAEILELLGIGEDNWISTNAYEGETLGVTTTTTEDIAASRDTKLAELGVTTGEFYIWKDGVKTTAYISSDETLGSFIDTLKSFGIETSLVNIAGGSKLSIEGSGNSYIQTSASTSNASNVVDQLFVDTADTENYRYSGYQETSTIVTNITDATEDTLLSKYNNTVLSLTSEGTLDVVVDGTESSIEITADETIGSLLNKFRALGLEATISDGVILIQDGYKTFSIKDTGTSDLVQTVGLDYRDDLGGYSASSVITEQTTESIEEVDLSVSNYANADTKMKLLNITDGSLTIYRDGQRATVSVIADETFGQLQDRIQESFGDVEITFNNGYLTFSSVNPGISIEVGSTTDSSNFSAITGITSDGTGKVKSARELYCVNESSLITTSGIFRYGDVTDGTFVIGDATFTIDDTTTLSSLISQINSSAESNAIAFWDTVDGKFVITSRTTGAALVNIEAGTSNFTDIMGLTESTWKADGEVDVTKMKVNAQEVGENARFSINGTYYTSTSNNITSDVSKIKGVTINLKSVSEGEEVELKIERDKETVATAVSDIVDAYNELIENVDKEIAKEAPLHDQSTLKLLRNQIRSIMTSSIAGTNLYKSLSSVGISLDEAVAGNINTDRIDVLNFNKDKFIEKFEVDRFAVRNLLVGTDTYDGIFTQVEKVVSQSLEGGYFTSAERSFNNQISRIDKKIKRANEEVERYRARLEAKFASMDLLISKMQNQFSSFLGT